MVYYTRIFDNSLDFTCKRLFVHERVISRINKMITIFERIR